MRLVQLATQSHECFSMRQPLFFIMQQKHLKRPFHLIIQNITMMCTQWLRFTRISKFFASLRAFMSETGIFLFVICSEGYDHRYISFYCPLQILRFIKIESLWQPCIEQVYQHHFPNTICSLCVSVSQFENFHDISFSLLLFFYGHMWSVTFDITMTYWRLRRWLASFSNKVFLH